MTIKQLNRYNVNTISQLHKLATKCFNQYIRTRDKDKGCVSCDSHVFSDAGHFYSAGHYPILRYDEKNVHGQCKRCNYFLSGNENEYRKRITSRISEDDLKELDYKVAYYRQHGYKWDRYFLIEIILKYK